MREKREKGSREKEGKRGQGQLIEAAMKESAQPAPQPDPAGRRDLLVLCERQHCSLLLC